MFNSIIELVHHGASEYLPHMFRYPRNWEGATMPKGGLWSCRTATDDWANHRDIPDNMAARLSLGSFRFTIPEDSTLQIRTRKDIEPYIRINHKFTEIQGDTFEDVDWEAMSEEWGAVELTKEGLECDDLTSCDGHTPFYGWDVPCVLILDRGMVTPLYCLGRSGLLMPMPLSLPSGWKLID